MDEAIDEIRRICREHNIIGVYNAEKVANKVMNNRLDYAKQQGREEGIQQNKAEMIVQMLKEGLPEEIIMRITKLTKEELNEFK